MYIHTYTGGDTARYRAAYRDDSRSLLRLDDPECRRVTDLITGFYRDHLSSSGLSGYVVGLSGGIDSTMTATLLADAVGPETVHGVIMPAAHTPDDAVDDALAVADGLGITTNDPDTFRDRIGDAVDTIEALGEAGDDQRVKRGNILARCRMAVLRDVAKARDSLVAGTTNASERDLGYMTLAADGPGGIDNEGLYDLYKTSERDLARFHDVPARVIEKAPTADLWAGQRDSDELSFTYDVLDRVLVGLRLDRSPAAIADVVDTVDAADAAAIRDRVERMRFKREPAPHASLS